MINSHISFPNKSSNSGNPKNGNPTNPKIVLTKPEQIPIISYTNQEQGSNQYKLRFSDEISNPIVQGSPGFNQINTIVSVDENAESTIINNKSIINCLNNEISKSSIQNNILSIGNTLNNPAWTHTNSNINDTSVLTLNPTGAHQIPGSGVSQTQEFDKEITNWNINEHNNQFNTSENNRNNNSGSNNQTLSRKSSFLTPDKRATLRQKFKEAKDKILSNQAEFIESIRIAIQNNNITQIRNWMLDEDNKRFYKRQLEQSNFLTSMWIQNRMEMLTEVWKDSFYHFDETFVFEYLSKKWKTKRNLLEEMDSISQFIFNVVDYGLYRKSLTRVLGWFIICFGWNDAFLALVKNNEKEYSLEYIQYNHFESEDDIQDYVEELANYRRVLILCLKEKLENLAIELVIYKGQLENSEVIESALEENSTIFLRYIWETSNNTEANPLWKGIKKRVEDDQSKLRWTRVNPGSRL